MSGVRVTIDPELCMGSGTCLAVAANLFDMGDVGVAKPRRSIVDPSTTLDEAITRCPTAAITAKAAE